MVTALVVLLIIAIVAVLWGVGIFNNLVRLRNQVRNAWSQIDVQLKRRHDLIPNLVETAKGYMKHERETLDSITKARSSAQAATGAGDAAKAEGALSAALARFFAVAENYPDLKANQNFLALQEELTSTENKIGFARQFYNDSALMLNNKTEMFPSRMIANAFSFKKEEFFELETKAEREVPQVKF
jgi:LemA protein